MRLRCRFMRLARLCLLFISTLALTVFVFHGIAYRRQNIISHPCPINSTIKFPLFQTDRNEKDPSVDLRTNDTSSTIPITFKSKNRKIHLSQIYRNELDPSVNLRTNNMPIVNHFDFAFPINMVNACNKDKGIAILMTIPSRVTNFERRVNTRNMSQGQYSRDKGNNATMIFFVGLPSSKDTVNSLRIQQLIREEAEREKDIVQINVVDDYHNIVQKAIGVLHWISKYCPNSEFVLKTDDDVIVNVPKLVTTLYRIRKSHPEFVIGTRRIDDKPVRDTYIKYYLSYEEYPSPLFPPFVLGGAMGYTTSTALLLYRQALRTKLIWLDDVFISGICTKKLGIPVLKEVDFTYFHIEHPKKRH